MFDVLKDDDDDVLRKKKITRCDCTSSRKKNIAYNIDNIATTTPTTMPYYLMLVLFH